MRNLTDRRRALLAPGGEKLYYNERTGCFYPKNLDMTIDGSRYVRNSLAGRYAYCENLESAVFRGIGSIGTNGHGGYPVNDCPNLKKLELPKGCGGDTYIAASCAKLESVVLGSVGFPVSAIYYNAFSGSGTAAAEKTITVYVKDDAALPLAYAPWGYTGAAVVYRSSATGEIREE